MTKSEFKDLKKAYYYLVRDKQKEDVHSDGLKAIEILQNMIQKEIRRRADVGDSSNI